MRVLRLPDERRVKSRLSIITAGMLHNTKTAERHISSTDWGRVRTVWYFFRRSDCGNGKSFLGGLCHIRKGSGPDRRGL